MSKAIAETTLSKDNEHLKDSAVAVKDAVKDLANETARYASHRVAGARDSAKQLAKTARTKAVEYQKTGTVYVQRNPYKAMAMAAGIGFVLGLLLKRR